LPDINPGYKITFNENKIDMSLIVLFFIFIFITLLISSTHILSYAVSFLACLLGYIFCRDKIASIWPKAGSLLLFSKDKIEINLSLIDDEYTYYDKSFIAKILPSSIHNEHFIVLKLKAHVKSSNINNWLILTKKSMNTTDFTRLRRMLVTLKQ